MYTCHISKASFVCPGYVLFAHILLPQAVLDKNHTKQVVRLIILSQINFSMYAQLSRFEFVLGIAQDSITTHSRLFIMLRQFYCVPDYASVRIDWHALLNCFQIVLLPYTPILNLIKEYIRNVYSNHIEETQCVSDLWTDMRKGQSGMTGEAFVCFILLDSILSSNL